MFLTAVGSMLELAQSVWKSFLSLDEIKAFLLSFLISLGIFSAREIVKKLVQYLQRKWLSSYERNAEDIRELHTNIHDRLCDLYVSIKLNEQQSNFASVKQRLLYNSARIRKHGNQGMRIANDIEQIVISLPDHKKGKLVVEQVNERKRLGDLLEKIRDNLDELWKQKC